MHFQGTGWETLPLFTGDGLAPLLKYWNFRKIEESKTSKFLTTFFNTKVLHISVTFSHSYEVKKWFVENGGTNYLSPKGHQKMCKITAAAIPLESLRIYVVYTDIWKNTL